MTGPHEVGLSHVAGMHGMSERDLVGRMSGFLAAGRLMDLLRVEAQARLYEWIDGKESDGEPFAVRDAEAVEDDHGRSSAAAPVRERRRASTRSMRRRL